MDKLKQGDIVTIVGSNIPDNLRGKKFIFFKYFEIGSDYYGYSRLGDGTTFDHLVPNENIMLLKKCKIHSSGGNL